MTAAGDLDRARIGELHAREVVDGRNGGAARRPRFLLLSGLAHDGANIVDR